MHYYTDIQSYQNTAPSSVTLGKFDGLHKGHQKLVERVASYARLKPETCGIVCAFDMDRESLLTPEERKERLANDIDCLIDCPFTPEIREMEAENFIREVIRDRFHAIHVVVGPDFRFGHERKGDVEMLSDLAPECGYELEVVEKECYAGEEISSSRIRQALEQGNVELARQLLGYPFSQSGEVEHGQELGRTLGFPTLNLVPEPGKIVPRYGVYVCQVEIDGKTYPGIGNVGVKPTVAKTPRLLVEIYAFDYQGDAYGKHVTARFLDFVRGEEKFDTVERLKVQVDQDICYGREYFARLS